MAYLHRPGYSTSYYEDEKEVIRGPCDSYSSEYRVEEYANPGYSMGRPHHHHHHHQNAGYVDKVTEVVSYESNPGYYGRDVEFVEKKEEIVYENGYEPYSMRKCF